MKNYILSFLVVVFIFIGCSSKKKHSTITPFQDERRILVIINSNSTLSQTIGNYYLRRRPSARVCHIFAPTSEEITRADFNDIKTQIENFLTNSGLKDEIYYIVTTSGVPLKIASSGGSEDYASVDSEIALLFNSYNINGKVPNPYYCANSHFDRRFNIYLVTRLTGYETDSDGDGIPDDVKNLIDRGLSPVRRPKGLFLFDVDPTKTGGYQVGNDWLYNASSLLAQRGYNVMLDTTNTFVTNQKNLIGYASWGSNDSNNTTPPYRSYHTYLAGALAVTYVSTNARSFLVGTPYGQCLVADLIKEGVTGAAGNTYEPYLDACCHPDILFDRYTNGFNLAESYYIAMPYLSWQTVVVGDPLCAPYR